MTGRLCWFVTIFRGFHKYPHAKLDPFLRELIPLIRGFFLKMVSREREGPKYVSVCDRTTEYHIQNPQSSPVFTDNKWSISGT